MTTTLQTPTPATRQPSTRRQTRRPIWEEPPSKTGQAAKSIGILVYLALIIIPIYTVTLTSFSTQGAINKAGGLVIYPDGLTLDAYRLIISGGVVIRALVISLAITAIGTAFSLTVTVLAAYGLSRTNSYGHRLILLILLISTFFTGGIIPLFLVVSYLHGYNAYWALILPGAVSVFNIIIMRAFFSTTAAEVIESGRIDGAGEWRLLTQIVLPMSKAVTAVIALFYAVTYWNSWFNILLFMPADSEKWPLQMVMYNYVTQGQAVGNTNIANVGTSLAKTASLSLQMAIVVLTIVPILFVFPLVSKHFTKGVLLGAVKG
jgi:multiple sugar transport system permease protein/putative aldouronate transport system permease protein